MALTRRVARTHQAAGEAARAGLHYVRPGVDPGYTRRRRGKAFVYHTPRGARLAHAGTLERIRKLVIPPAWEEVWISVDPRGHVQATGRDARRRLQYRYHPLWSEHRHTDKFSQLGELCRALPRVR